MDVQRDRNKSDWGEAVPLPGRAPFIHWEHTIAHTTEAVTDIAVALLGSAPLSTV